MSQQTRSRPSTRRRSRIATAALVLLAAAAAGCQDQPQGLTAPDAPSRYTGTYNPAVSSEVRATPSVVSPGKTYRFWYQVRNTSPDVRSYWVWGYEGSGTLQQVGRTADFSLQPGERRWVYTDMAVQTPSANTQDVDLYFDVHDGQGDALGYTRHIQPVRVSKLLPAVGFVGENYTQVSHGQTHQNVYPGEIKTVRVRLGNPLGVQHTICTNWLDDEGYTGQTTRPQPATRCVLVPAYGQTELNFAYRVPSTATAGTLDKQTLQVYSLADPNAVVYGYLRTTTAAQPTQQAFRRFYAWTNTAWKSTPDIALQVKATDARSDRVYVEFNTDPVQKKLHFSPVPASGGGCDSACLTQFARSNPGRLYVVADEPAQHGISPASYAEFYGRVVAAIRNEDPTARFSPAGIEQWNPLPGAYPSHGTQYAESFVNEYRTIHKQDPPVAEWRFHYLDATDMTEWQDSVAARAKWAKDHGAPLVLGSFGFPNNSWEQLSSETASAYMQYTMFPSIKSQGWLNGRATPFGADPSLAGWIISAVWYGYDVGNYHRLCCSSTGGLTLEGFKFTDHQY